MDKNSQEINIKWATKPEKVSEPNSIVRKNRKICFRI